MSDTVVRRGGAPSAELEELRALRAAVAQLQATVSSLSGAPGAGAGMGAPATAPATAPVRGRKRALAARALPLLLLLSVAVYCAFLQAGAAGARRGGGAARVAARAAAALSSALTAGGSGGSASGGASGAAGAAGAASGAAGATVSGAGAAAAPCDPLVPLTKRDLPPLPATYRGRDLTGRSLYITVITSDHVNVLLENWPSQERHLLTPTDAHFMLAVPDHDADAVIAAVEHSLGWEKVMDFTRPQRTYACEGAVDMVAHAGAGWYRSPGGVTILLVVRRFRLPKFIETASYEDLAKPCGLLKCCNGDGSGTTLQPEEVEYSKTFSVINIAFVHHLLLDEPLVDAYDYVFKIDADISFLRDVPDGGPGAIMQKTGCVLMQSEILEVGSHLHCVKPLVSVMQRYAALQNLTVRSAHHGWCEQMNLYIYGNFVGFWRPFVRSRAMLSFMRWLFENDERYFNYNDQGSTRAYLCSASRRRAQRDPFMCSRHPTAPPPAVWYDIPYLNSLPYICDLLSWRGGVFTHP
jgi:hypothetical protein